MQIQKLKKNENSRTILNMLNFSQKSQDKRNQLKINWK